MGKPIPFPSFGEEEMKENKADKIVRECKETGEPWIPFRAKDLLSLFPLKAYEEAIEKWGNAEQGEQIAQIIDDFKEWQRNNPSKVRFPD